MGNEVVLDVAITVSFIATVSAKEEMKWPCSVPYKSSFPGFPGGSEVKVSACNAGDLGLIPGSGRSPGEGNGNPLQYSVLGEEISGLSHSVVFLYFFALIAEEGFLIFSCYSLELCIQMLISFLFSFAFRFSSFHSYL